MKLPEPDDVDFTIGYVQPDSLASLDTMTYIAEIKQNPTSRAESEEADRILAALGLDARNGGILDADALLDHWHQCVADLAQTDPGETTSPIGDNATHSTNTAGPSVTRRDH